MIGKAIRLVALPVAGSFVIGGAIFGRELCSYVNSSARSVREAVTESVPVEFQLRRARDLVDDIVPEMQANIKVIAEQEVEITGLHADIEQSHKQLDEQRQKIAALRQNLSTANVSFTYGPFVYTRDQVKDDLAHRFDVLKQAEVVLGGKERLLENRQKSLVAAEQALQRTREQKQLLESQISALESQNQLVKAASVGTSVAFDSSKLAQSQKLIGEIKKQLDVAERVLAHESTFVEPIQVDVVSESDLLKQVDEHMTTTTTPNALTASR